MMSTMNVCLFCNEPAELKCSWCKDAAYCGRSHQRMHWEVHRLQCTAYEIKESEELGRYMVAARNIKRDDIVLIEKPLVFGPRTTAEKSQTVPCIGCNRTIDLTQCNFCERCRWPACSNACSGLMDKKRHFVECLFLSSLPQNSGGKLYRYDVIYVLRCLLLQIVSPKKWEALMNLISHMECRGKETEVYKDVEQRIVSYLQENFARNLHEFKAKINAVSFDFSSELIHKICGIIDSNALETNETYDFSALFSIACLMEHNCTCNTYHHFAGEEDGYKVTVKAAKLIKKGENISICYTDVLWNTQARKAHLRENKYFSCGCERCSDPTENDSNMGTLRCLGVEGAPCDGFQLAVDPKDEATDWACDKCDIRVGGEQVAELLHRLEADVELTLERLQSYRQLEDLLEKLKRVLHPNHSVIYPLSHTLIQMYGSYEGIEYAEMDDELLEKKIQLCRQLLDINSKIDPYKSRLRLYHATIAYELFTAMRESKIRKSLPMTHHEEQLLTDAQDVLKHEMKNDTGRKLMRLIENTLYNFRELYY